MSPHLLITSSISLAFSEHYLFMFRQGQKSDGHIWRRNEFSVKVFKIMSDLESTDLQTVGATLGFLVEGACEFGKCKGTAKGRKVRRTEEANHILEPCAELCKGVCVCTDVCTCVLKDPNVPSLAGYSMPPFPRNSANSLGTGGNRRVVVGSEIDKGCFF